MRAPDAVISRWGDIPELIVQSEARPSKASVTAEQCTITADGRTFADRHVNPFYYTPVSRFQPASPGRYVWIPTARAIVRRLTLGFKAALADQARLFEELRGEHLLFVGAA